MTKDEFGQTGFAALEAILILIIVAVIGGIGWYAVHTKHQTDRILSQADKISQSTPVKKISSSTPGNEIVIKEWGIGAPYTGKLSLHYSIKSDFATFWSDEGNAATQGKCMDYMGGIQRYLPSDNVIGRDGPTAEQDAKANPGSYTHLGNYYYIFRHSQALCPDENENNTAAINLLGDTSNAVRDLSTHLQLVQ